MCLFYLAAFFFFFFSSNLITIPRCGFLYVYPAWGLLRFLNLLSWYFWSNFEIFWPLFFMFVCPKLSSSSENSSTCMLDCLTLFHRALRLWCFLQLLLCLFYFVLTSLFFFFFFSISLWRVFTLPDLFSCGTQFVVKLIVFFEFFFHFRYCIFQMQSFHLPRFYSVHFSLLRVPN